MNDPMNAPLPTSTPAFDANEFMNMAVEGVGSVVLTPIPAGRHLAMIGPEESDVRATPFTDKVTGETRLRLDVTYHLVDDSGAIRAAIDGREPRHTQGYFLDVVPGTYRLDMGKGKNVSLNKVREAVGQNTGAAWAPPMLRGAGPLWIEMVIDPDKQDSSILRNRIKAVGKPA